jgi:hypothetical protein
MYVDVLFHWSPRECKPRILRRGLLPGRKPSRCFSDPDDDGFRRPMVCLSSDPKTAWGLSGDVFGARGQVWDLWQVRVSDDDNLHTMPTYGGGHIAEFRISNRIPKSRLWWVAERTI